MSSTNHGLRLKTVVNKKNLSVTKLAEILGYADRRTVYDLFDREYFKKPLMDKVLNALEMTLDEFLQTDQEEPAPKRYIEDRIESLEKMVNEIQIEISRLKIKPE